MFEEFRRFLRGYKFLSLGLKAIGRNLRRVGWSLTRSKAMELYLRSHEVRKLQIGAGPNILKGWLNTDVQPLSKEVLFLDAAQPFPFGDCTFDYIFTEHLIEHLPFSIGLNLIRECYRVLRPGGRVRIATPNLETLLGLYTPEKNPIQQRYIKWITDKFIPEAYEYSETVVINNAFHNWGHQFLYDRITLQNSMEKVGFGDIGHYSTGESDDDTLRGLESHGEAMGDEDMNRFETMILEGIRRA